MLAGLVAASGLGGQAAPSSQASAQAPSFQASGNQADLAAVNYFSGHLSLYEPTYFILGTYPAAEYQFSVKYKLFDLKDSTDLYSEIPLLDPISFSYVAYTQTSFWTLLTPDPFFYDTSYKPSAFLYYKDFFKRIHKTAPFSLGLQAGFEHESNGRGGSGERSVYSYYVQPTATFKLPDSLRLTFQPRVWTYWDVNPNNPNIADYRGYGLLRTALTGNKFQIESTSEVGRGGRHFSEQVDLRFNLPTLGVISFNPTVQLQYFTGYGETLRDYDLPISGFRAGICIYYDHFRSNP